jgi:glycosyltransferase involved in cell wall biosynthesis
MIGMRGIPHTYSGNEEFVRQLAPRLVARGHDVTVYCRSGSFSDRGPTWQGVRRVFYPAPDHKSLGQFVHASEAMVDAVVRRPDIIYVHTLPSAPHTVLPWLLRRRVVVNVDGMDWERAKWGPVGRAYFRTAVRIVLRTATAIVTDAQAMRAFYLERFGRDTYCIAYGAELDTGSYPDVLERYGLAAEQYYLIASRLVPENNADLIVQAFTQTDSNRQLVVAGSANFRSPWVERLRASADGRVRFLGHVSDPRDMLGLHRHCYAYVHGHSLGGTNPSLLKALGAGNCVLALDTPFNREVLVDDAGVSYGVLFPKDVGALVTAITELDRDPRCAAEFRSRARDRIKQAYTWDFIADEYERMFNAVLSNGGPGHTLP